MGQKDLLSKLADRGETVIGQIRDLPGAHQIMEAGTGFRERLDELGKRVRGVEALEKRVQALERRLEQLEGGRPAKRTAAKSAAPKKTAAAVKKSAAAPRRKPKPAEPAA